MWGWTKRHCAHEGLEGARQVGAWPTRVRKSQKQGECVTDGYRVRPALLLGTCRVRLHTGVRAHARAWRGLVSEGEVGEAARTCAQQAAACAPLWPGADVGGGCSNEGVGKGVGWGCLIFQKRRARVIGQHCRECAGHRTDSCRWGKSGPEQRPRVMTKIFETKQHCHA